MTRVVAGAKGGRRLAIPPGATRPTSEKVREALGSALTALDAIAGVRVLDLFAGSGAVAIELLSRGAAAAVLVEHGAKAAATARANIKSVDVKATVINADVSNYVAQPATSTFDVVFIDPPYDLPTSTVENVVRHLIDNGWLDPAAVVVVERRFRDGGITWPAGIEPYRDKRYGDTVLFYGLRSS
jgi:16S rRNA (guanine966-N2)-methyltransferase